MNKTSEEQQSARSLFSGSVVVVLLKVLGLAAGFGIYFLLAKDLGPGGFGIYSYVLSIGVIASIVARLGLDAVVIRVMVQSRSQGQQGLAKGIVRWSVAMTVGLCAVLSLFIAYHAYYIDRPEVILAIPIMIGVALTSLATSILRGIDLGPWTAWPEFTGRPLLTFSIIATALFFAYHLTPANALSIQAIIAMSLAMLIVFQVLWFLPKEMEDARPEYDVNGWVLIALPVLWNSIILLSEPQLVVIISGVFLPPEEVGPIALVARMAALAGIAEVGLNFLVPPMLSRLFQQDATAKMTRIMRLAGRIMVLPTIPALIIFYVFGKEILGYFGEAYLIAYWPLIVFTLARAIAGLFGPTAIMLLMSAYEKDVAVASTISVVAMVIVALLLVGPLGPLGMAIAVLVSTALRVGMNWYSVYHRLGINSAIFLTTKVVQTDAK